ncbi:hypothetical protein CFR73_14280 [Novacetimonas maltaceti]|nr:hypothetical protein CFR73_14280 [Novacetimonas maltaceti]
MPPASAFSDERVPRKGMQGFAGTNAYGTALGDDLQSVRTWGEADLIIRNMMEFADRTKCSNAPAVAEIQRQ